MTQTIPLFPLDVVLFPGMRLPLHIFEERYRKMVRDCQERGEPFGVIWAEREPIQLSPDLPLIGTKATMTEIESLPDGRFNIHTVGGERFRVRNLSHDEPYLVGEIEAYPSLRAYTPKAYATMPKLLHLFERYLSLLGEWAGKDVALTGTFTDPSALAYAVAVLYQGQNWRKQKLLTVETIPDLMEQQINLLRIENPILARDLRHQEAGTLPPLIPGSFATYGFN